MFKKNDGIVYDVTLETGRMIDAVRRENSADKLKANLSELAGALPAIVALGAIHKGMQTYGVAEKDFEGYVLKEPVAQEEIRPRVSAIQALNERVREHELFQAVQKATYEELARLDAREKWEASKQAAATPSPATTPPAPPVVKVPASEPKAKRTTAFNGVLPYLQTVYGNGNFRTTDVFIRELGRQSGEVNSPFKKAARTDVTFYLKSGGQSVSHSLIADRMKSIR